MVAREKFQVGQHVRMTRAAIDQGLDGPLKRRTGRVVGFSRDGTLVRINRYGEHSTTVHVYSPAFWEVPFMDADTQQSHIDN